MRTILDAARDIYRREYTAEEIKKWIDLIFYVGGLVFTLLVPLIALVWCSYVFVDFLVQLRFSKDPSFIDLLEKPWISFWAALESRTAWVSLINHGVIDLKKLTLIVTFLAMLALTVRFLWSLYFNSLRHIFENTFHSEAFRQSVFNDYKAWIPEDFMLRFNNRFLLMAALNFVKPNPEPALIPGQDACDRPVGGSNIQGWWWRRWACWCWLIRHSTVKYPMRIGYAIVKFHPKEMNLSVEPSTSRKDLDSAFNLSVEPSTYRKDLDSAYTLGYAYVSWYRSKIRHCLGWKPAPIKYLHGKLETMRGICWFRNAAGMTRCDFANCANPSVGGTKKTAKDGTSGQDCTFLKQRVTKCFNDAFIDWVNDQVYIANSDSNSPSTDAVIRPGLGVQAITIFNDHADNKDPNKPNWKVIIQKRAANVASSPGHFQFIPSGGFESHQTYRRHQFDTLLQNTLKRECSLERGLLREFAEEVLGVPEFATNEKLDPDDVYREPSIVELRRLMADAKKNRTKLTDNEIVSACIEDNYGRKNGRKKKYPWAAMVPLGTALSLVGFKPEISYALIIDSKQFFIERKLQRAENEATGILTWPLIDLDHLVNGEQHFVDASYVLLKLLLQEKEMLTCLLTYSALKEKEGKEKGKNATPEEFIEELNKLFEPVA